MLESLHIQGFQTHEDFELEFGSTICSISGASDLGKSSIIRSLRWLATNKPSGDKFINWGCKEASVSLTIDGQQITRTKSNKENSYRINSDKPLVSFGQGVVPDPVAKILNLSELSFAKQHDKPVWFQNTAGEVSRELNALVDLSLIDSTLANLAAEQRRSKSVVEICEGRLKEAKVKRSNTAWAEEANESLTQLEQTGTQLSENRIKRARLASTIENAGKLQEVAQNAEEAKNAGLVAIAAAEKLVGVREKREKLLKLCRRMAEAEQLASKRIPEKAIAQLESIYGKWQEVSSRNIALQNMIDRIKAAEEESCRLQQESTTLKAELRKAFGSQCPLCNQPIKFLAPS